MPHSELKKILIELGCFLSLWRSVLLPRLHKIWFSQKALANHYWTRYNWSSRRKARENSQQGCRNIMKALPIARMHPFKRMVYVLKVRNCHGLAETTLVGVKWPGGGCQLGQKMTGIDSNFNGRWIWHVRHIQFRHLVSLLEQHDFLV